MIKALQWSKVEKLSLLITPKFINKTLTIFLQFAIENDLKVKVEISQMDANTCMASSIYIMIEELFQISICMKPVLN